MPNATNLPTYQDPQDDAALLSLVQWLTEKTRKGRVIWESQPAILQAHLVPSVLIQFTTVPCGDEGNDWRLFVIRDAHRELYRVHPPSEDSGNIPLTFAVDALFSAVCTTKHRIQ